MKSFPSKSQSIVSQINGSKKGSYEAATEKAPLGVGRGRIAARLVTAHVVRQWEVGPDVIESVMEWQMAA